MKSILEHLNLKMVSKSCLFQSRQKKVNKNHPPRPWQLKPVVSMSQGASPDWPIFGTGSYDFEFCKIAIFGKQVVYKNKLVNSHVVLTETKNDRKRPESVEVDFSNFFEFSKKILIPRSEHLLFMGTEKYPDENHFEEFIGRFGGYSNASTHESFTRYHVSHIL